MLVRIRAPCLLFGLFTLQVQVHWFAVGIACNLLYQPPHSSYESKTACPSGFLAAALGRKQPVQPTQPGIFWACIHVGIKSVHSAQMQENLVSVAQLGTCGCDMRISMDQVDELIASAKSYIYNLTLSSTLHNQHSTVSVSL